jgi:hypothetical protein
MREKGDKGKKRGEKSRGREKGEEEWEKTTPCPPPHRFRDSFCLWNHKCTSHPCHLKFNKVQPPLFSMLPAKQKTKTPFAKNDPSQDLFKSKYVFVKTNDYMIFCG